MPDGVDLHGVLVLVDPVDDPVGPAPRGVVTVGLLQEEALPVWREMAAVPGMGPHAKFALFTMEAGPEPDEGEWLWLAVESAAVALADKGPDEAVTVLWEALSAEKLAADDLEHRLAVVRATGHPSALSLAAAIADFVASAGAEKLSVNQCLQLKVSLARWKPPIWRTALIPATANLAALHLVIQALYGWSGDHLHAFRVRRKYRGDSPVEYPDYDSDEEQQPEPFDLEAVNRRLAG